MNIVITGASRGIGYQTCLQLAREDNHLIVALGRNLDSLIQLSQMAEQQGCVGKIIPVSVDLSEQQSIHSACTKISTHFTSVDIIINNAGRLINKPFEELSALDWRSIYSVNLFGVIELIKELMPLLKTENSKSKHIVNISSMGGVQGSQKFKGLSAYSSSKAALICLTECLSAELLEYNIKVNCLALGSVSTEMFQEAFPSFQASTSPEAIAKWIASFAVTGHNFFNGKIIPVSTSTP